MSDDLLSGLAQHALYTLKAGHAVDVLRDLPDHCVRTCITSPPYFGLRDYGADGQIGLERTPDQFVQALVAVFREVNRVLTPDGTLWLNLGDSYVRIGGTDKKVSPTAKTRGTRNTLEARRNRTQRVLPEGLKPKDLIGIPWMVAFALRADGWWLRQDNIWAKPNPMPEAVTDRTTRAHEYVFMLSKAARYFYDADAIKEPASPNTHARGKGVNPKARVEGEARTGNKQNASFSAAVAAVVPFRNKRSVWTVAPEPQKVKHYAAFPTELIRPCVLAGSAPGDLVLDPFCGTGTTGVVALRYGRRFLGIDIQEKYVAIAQQRLDEELAKIEGTAA